MLEFGLTREHLQNLPRKELFPKKAVYNIEDVYHKALQVCVCRSSSFSKFRFTFFKKILDDFFRYMVVKAVYSKECNYIKNIYIIVHCLMSENKRKSGLLHLLQR